MLSVSGKDQYIYSSFTPIGLLSVATWLILCFLFFRPKETFYMHPHTCKGKWEQQIPKRQMLLKP